MKARSVWRSVKEGILKRPHEHLNDNSNEVAGKGQRGQKEIKDEEVQRDARKRRS